MWGRGMALQRHAGGGGLTAPAISVLLSSSPSTCLQQAMGLPAICRLAEKEIPDIKL